MTLCCSVNRRMAQLEDELTELQRQLELLKKTLANVVDVATHRHHKDTVSAKLKSKVDTEVMERRHDEMIKAQKEQLLEALADKVDAWALDECRRELANVTQCSIAGLEKQHMELSQNINEDRASIEDLRCEQGRMFSAAEKQLLDLERHQQALAKSLANKADFSAFEEECRHTKRIEKSQESLDSVIRESLREQYSYLESVKLDNQVVQDEMSGILQRHGIALDLTRKELAALSGLEQRFIDFQEQAATKQEDWLHQKEVAANRIFSMRKERQDEELAQILAKKADLSWYEQQKAVLDATQMSLAAQQNNCEDLQRKLKEKVDHPTLERTQERLLLEIAQARQETADVSSRLGGHQHHLDLARAQVIEITRLHTEIEASLCDKADKASLESSQWHLETISSKLDVIERRQDEARQDFRQLQEQFFAALRSRSASGNGSSLPKKMIEPPPSPLPRERLAGVKPSPAHMKYRCEVSPIMSARRKMGGN